MIAKTLLAAVLVASLALSVQAGSMAEPEANPSNWYHFFLKHTNCSRVLSFLDKNPTARAGHQTKAEEYLRKAQPEYSDVNIWYLMGYQKGAMEQALASRAKFLGVEVAIEHAKDLYIDIECEF